MARTVVVATGMVEVVTFELVALEIEDNISKLGNAGKLSGDARPSSSEVSVLGVYLSDRDTTASSATQSPVSYRLVLSGLTCVMLRRLARPF